MSRLVSGKVEKKYGANLSADRFEFLSLDQAEPDLGVPDNADPVKKYVLTVGGTRNRTWVELNSDQITEGDRQLFFTEPRVRALFGAGKGINLSADGIISTKGDDSGLGLYNTGVIKYSAKTPDLNNSNIIVFPYNDGLPYIAYSILATNISEGNLVYLTCNVIYSTKTGYTVNPTMTTDYALSSNTAFELLLKPLIFGQGDVIQATVRDQNGVKQPNLVSFYVSYQQSSDIDFIFEDPATGGGPGGKLTSNAETIIINTTLDKNPIVAESLLLVNESSNLLPVSCYIRIMPAGITYDSDFPLSTYPIAASILKRFSIPPSSSVEVFERPKAIPGDSLVTLTNLGKPGDNLSYFYGAKKTAGWLIATSKSLLSEKISDIVYYNVTAKNQNPGQLVFWELVPLVGRITATDFLYSGVGNFITEDKTLSQYAFATNPTLHKAFYDARTFALNDAREGRFSIQVNPDRNTDIEGDEIFEVRLYTVSKNETTGEYILGSQQAQGGKVTILDTSTSKGTPSLSIFGPSFVSEDEVLTFELTHPNYGAGSTLYYRTILPAVSDNNNIIPDANTFVGVTTLDMTGNVILDSTYMVGNANIIITGTGVSGTASAHKTIMRFKTAANCVPTGKISKFRLLVSDTPISTNFAAPSGDVTIADSSAAQLTGYGGISKTINVNENGLTVSYKYHIFTQDGSFTLARKPTIVSNIDLFMIAGGGGGGAAAAQRWIAKDSNEYSTPAYLDSGWTGDAVNPWEYSYTGGGGGSGAVAYTMLQLPPNYDGSLAITVGRGGSGGTGDIDDANGSHSAYTTGFYKYSGQRGENGYPSSIVSVVPGSSIFSNIINLEVYGGGGGGSNTPGRSGGTGGGAGWGTFELGNYANQLRVGGNVLVAPANNRRIGGPDTNSIRTTSTSGYDGGWAQSTSKDNNVKLGLTSPYILSIPIGYNTRMSNWSTWAPAAATHNDQLLGVSGFQGGGSGGGGGAGEKGNRLLGGPGNARYFSATYASTPTPNSYHNYILTTPTAGAGTYVLAGFDGGIGTLISSGSWLASINSDLQQQNLLAENGATLSGLGEPTGNGGEFYIGGGGGGAGALVASGTLSVPGNYSITTSGGWAGGGSFLASGGTGGKGGGGNGALHYGLLVETGTNALNALDSSPGVTSINSNSNGSQFGATTDLYAATNMYSDFMPKLPGNWDFRDYFHGKNAKPFTGGGGGGAYRTGSRMSPAPATSNYRLNSQGVIGQDFGRKDSRYRAEGKAGDGAPGIVILRYKITS
jgi:hypothetical protein